MGGSIDFPALQTAVGNQSASFQSRYLWLIRLEYGFLVIASFLAMDFSETPTYYAVYAIVFLSASFIMLFRSTTQPEQKWYKARAATESIKTSSWRYMMKAHPYEDSPSVDIPNRKFRDYIKLIIKTNSIMRDAIGAAGLEGQVTTSMREIRCLPFEERKRSYLEFRIDDQRTWYVNKARANKNAFRRWVIASAILYAASIIMSILHIVVPNIRYIPIEPAILGASFFLGWIQIKKHSELAATYTLTAVEIGLAREALEEIKNENDFSDFINDTELVFSREHTQWVARQETSG
jgi:hypothetical protein